LGLIVMVAIVNGHRSLLEGFEADKIGKEESSRVFSRSLEGFNRKGERERGIDCF